MSQQRGEIVFHVIIFCEFSYFGFKGSQSFFGSSELMYFFFLERVMSMPYFYRSQTKFEAR